MGELIPRETRRRVVDAEVSSSRILAIALAVIAVIAIGDYLTGPYLVFATFYLLPVAMVAWWAGRGPALAVGVLAAVTGAVCTLANPGEVGSGVVLWNAIVRFVSYAVVGVLVAAERDALRRVDALASTDPLTGLANRRSFYERAELELARSRRTGASLALAYVDVDDLKVRNDRDGHEAGDAMLQQFADLVRGTVRSVDVIARLGGDEFCVLLPDTDRAQAAHLVRRLVDVLAAATPTPIQVSIGLVSGPAVDGLEVEDIVRTADHLMMAAKQAGKGQVRESGDLALDPSVG